MQNRYCSSNDAGYVALTGWQCGACGCENQGCDCCRRCGWNRCGAIGRVVCAETRQNSPCGCEKAAECRSSCDACEYAADARQASCDTCQPDRMTGQSVQSCPNNTTLRSWADETADCGCAAANQGCYGQRNGCTAPAQTCTASRQNCGCHAAANQGCYGQRNGCAAPAQSCTGGRHGCRCHAADNQTNARQACGCDACTANRAASSRYVNAGVGMVYAVDHQLDQVYQSESALRTGTLFPELHKPLNGYCPGNGNCSTTGQQSAFAAWDLRLYLDTHPDDQQAQALFSRLCREVEDPSYATAFLDGSSCGTQWDWTDDPWPWECQPCGQ